MYILCTYMYILCICYYVHTRPHTHTHTHNDLVTWARTVYQYMYKQIWVPKINRKFHRAILTNTQLTQSPPPIATATTTNTNTVQNRTVTCAQVVKKMEGD